MEDYENEIPVRERLSVDESLTGDGVTVALVEFGFGYHPDLESDDSRTVTYIDPLGQFEANDDELIFGKQHQHGIGSASIAGGNGKASDGLHKGIAPHADMFLIKAHMIDDEGKPKYGAEHVNRALSWAVEHQDEYDIRVIDPGIALATGDALDMGRGMLPWVMSPAKQRVEWAVSRGILFICPVGNGSGACAPHMLAAPSALFVGGVDISANPDDTGKVPITPYPCFGGMIFGGRKVPDIAAPAVDMVQAQGSQKSGPEIRKDTFGYKKGGGTSWAGPFVTGVIAQMLEVNPNLGPQDVIGILRETAHPVAGIAEDLQGAGVIQPAEATKRARSAKGSPGYSKMSFEDWQKLTFGMPDDAMAWLGCRDESVKLDGALAACHHGPALNGRTVGGRFKLLINDPSPWVRSAIICTIGQQDPEQWDAALVEPALEDKSPHVRCAALWALNRRLDTNAKRYITLGLNDDHQDVRLRAAEDAVHRAERPLLPVLINAMQAERGILQFDSLRRAAEKITAEKLAPDDRKTFDNTEEIMAYNRDVAKLWAGYAA